MELGRSGRVQAGRRFIKEQRPGFLDDGQRDAPLLAHALGVEPDAPPECLRRQPGGPERVLQPRAVRHTAPRSPGCTTGAGAPAVAAARH
ncbi:hypothetical protein G6F60_015079 [Rhizopus arrhizus]|nr:hypothetical protein G6F60_015079 [Rhizopus arrhizus]